MGMTFINPRHIMAMETVSPLDWKAFLDVYASLGSTLSLSKSVSDKDEKS